MKSRITDRSLAGLKAGETLWDSDVAGLGARKRREDGSIVFVLKYRSPVERDPADPSRGRQRMVTLGRRGRGDLGIDDARKDATALRLELRAGRDPALKREADKLMPTVAELAASYLAAAERGELLTRGRSKRPSTVATDRSRIARHIVPLLGGMRVDAVTAQDVRRAMHAIAAGKTAAARPAGRGAATTGGRGAATRTIGLLGSLFTYAVREGLRSDNPVRGVERYADGKRERRLSDADYAALGAALRLAESLPFWLPAIGATRLLLLTGWRLGEVLGLTWQDVDLVGRTAVLPDTKTGKSLRPLSHAACDVLRAMSFGKGLVFPATRGNGRMSGFPRLYGRLLTMAKVPADITPHVLRHSFASLAADIGLSEPTIGALIGHKSGSITGRYTHLADAPLLTAADKVAGETLARMGEIRDLSTVVALRVTGGPRAVPVLETKAG